VTGLYPTPTRLDLLGAIARGEVDGQARSWWDHDGRKRTTQVREMQREHWVAPGEPPPAGRIVAATEAPGRSVLTAAGRCCHCGSKQLHITVCEHVLQDVTTEAARWYDGAEGEQVQVVCPDPGCPAQALCEACWRRL
jgi:hypothetical protein